MRRIILIVALAALTLPLIAQERITLTVPEAAPSLARYQIDQLVLKFDDPGTPADEAVIQITLTGVERADSLVCTYSRDSVAVASVLLNGLNKANLASAYNNNATTGSLRQRIHHRLVIMNEATTVCGRALTGTLTGAPQ